ncbi:glycosyltransferase [Mucilaginibacter sp.]|uniref:glycosyltransferase n=1 Tax=Mucilaginibacter sp. TaxID=1882438 RepID=UPI00283D2354|nr:glycosyltransferase [Mucilaginibacter sp.]MDR3695467.1 glycosyltransferase [Mucilaginibacter sp.]
MKGISVIVCCYNSALRLPETLKHLALQKVSIEIPWEIIVVNNASNDNTVQIAIEEWRKYENKNIKFKVVDACVAGLSFAREKGIAESEYGYLIFCDDDNWFFENYIENAFKLLETWPDAGIIGGYGLPAPAVEPPEWFKNYSSYYATGSQNLCNGIIAGNSPGVYGAGAVIRKTALQQLKEINFETIATDRRNEKLSSGGDIELCFAIKLLGYNVCYSDHLKFHHFIPENRLSKKYLLALVYQFGYCDILHRPYYWLFNSSLPKYKKTWFWVLMISLNIYLISLINLFKRGNSLARFIHRINLSHSKGRLTAIIKLNWRIQKYYKLVCQKFKQPIN